LGENQEQWRKSECGGDELFDSDRFQEMPLLHYVELAYQKSSVNTWERDGKSGTWELVRYLKARQEFMHVGVDEVLAKLPTLIELSDEEMADIADEWEEVEFVAGMGPLEWAAKMAADYPLKNPPGPKLRLYTEFIGIAAHLQILRGDAPILLPVSSLARILKTKPRTISRLRQLAQRHGLLEEVVPYKMRQRATQFRFDVNLFPALRERQ
jgi:hypothetical protein